MIPLYPMQFHPVFRQYVWGGRRLATVLGKSIGPEEHYAESWEICDLEAGQSVVAAGPLAGTTLHELVAQQGRELLGKHYPLKKMGTGTLPESASAADRGIGAEPVPIFSPPLPRFPLLLKFLDAAQTLSVQVHPDDALAARLNPPAVGKTEAWVVMAAEPQSLIYAGLKPGVDRSQLAAAIEAGRCQECLNAFHPREGDCVFLPAGAVHALGSGLLVAEIQQPSDVTYRLFDWNRVGLDGMPRPLHIEQGLAAIHFNFGPVMPCQPRATNRPQVARLVQCDQFTLDRWRFDSPQSIGGDERFHVLIVLEGSMRIEGNPAEAAISRGGTVLLPAGLGEVRITPLAPSVLLEGYLR
jgi:mannose-6-phosphate isomerase